MEGIVSYSGTHHPRHRVLIHHREPLVVERMQNLGQEINAGSRYLAEMPVKNVECVVG